VEAHAAGILVTPGDADAAAAAILALLADPLAGDAMGRAGRALAVERHSWHHVVTVTDHILRQAGTP